MMKTNSFESPSFAEKSDDKKESKKKKKKKSASKDAVIAVEKNDESEKDADVKKSDEESSADKKDYWLLFEDESKENAPEVPENPEDISDGEAKLIARQLVEVRGDELEQDIVAAEADSPEEAVLLANAAFIDKVSEKLDSNEQVDDAVLDQAVAEVAEELDINIPESDAEEEPVEEANVEATVDPTSHIEDEDKLTETANTATSTGTSIPPAPPMTPTNPPTPPTGFGAMYGNAAMPPGGASVNSLNSRSNNPNIAPATHSSPERRYQRGADLLVGGIIGYLIGRRRGRIKTEERLIPVQKSLEKKVKDLNEKITFREEKIRKLTSEKVAREGEDARKSISEKVEAKAHAKLEAKEKAKDAVEQKEIVSKQLEKVVTEKVSVIQPEKLGSVIVPKPETTIEQHTEFKVVSKESIRQMPDAVILEAAKKVEVDGTNAKEMYEQGKLSKDDLREIVYEQAKGGRPERVLIERMRPVRSSETMERLHREGGSQSGDDSSGGASSLPPVQAGSGFAQSMDGKVGSFDQNDSTNNLAQPVKQQKSKAPIVWVTGAVIAAAGAALLIF